MSQALLLDKDPSWGAVVSVQGEGSLFRILRFEPSLDVLRLRSDVISAMNILCFTVCNDLAFTARSTLLPRVEKIQEVDCRVRGIG